MTAEENHLNPWKYMEVVMAELSQIPEEERTIEVLRNYLPYSEGMIAKCKISLVDSDAISIEATSIEVTE